MKDFIDKHFGGVMGGAIGLVLAILLMAIGFWRTLVIIIFVFIGAFLGSNKMIKRVFNDLIDKIIGKKDLK